MVAEPVMPDWAGLNPYFLAIEADGEEPLRLIDLDERGWAATYAELMRAPGVWYLVRKADRAVMFSMRVEEGEQPYYTGRHVGVGLMGGGTAFEAMCYGIGKKKRDVIHEVQVRRRKIKTLIPGGVDRVWILPNGMVVLGDDVEWFATRMLREQLVEQGILHP